MMGDLGAVTSVLKPGVVPFRSPESQGQSFRVLPGVSIDLGFDTDVQSAIMCGEGSADRLVVSMDEAM